jgi:hypothetical protein
MDMDTYREILWLLDEAAEDIGNDHAAWAALDRARYLVTDLWLQGMGSDVYTLTDMGRAAVR